jgi:hypothetical protein
MFPAILLPGIDKVHYILASDAESVLITIPKVVFIKKSNTLNKYLL